MKFATEAIHAAYNPDEHNRAIMPPIYQNSMFAMKEIGEQIPFRYARLSNPTRKVLEDTVAALEHGAAGFAFGSGMAGIDCVFRTFLRPGDTVVAVCDIYGGSYDLLTEVYAPWGVNVVFADLTDPANLDRALAENQNVKLVWLETPSNPLLRLVDIAALAAIAHQAGALLAVDNCFATPVLQRPLALGADLVVHSGTKFLDGQGRVMAGAVCGSSELIGQLSPVARAAGLTLSPFNAWVVHKGLETLSLRVRAQSEAALQLARWLESQPAVERVYYPGLPSHPQHALAMQQQGGLGGAVLAFSLPGSTPDEARRRAFHLIDSLRVCSIATNLGDVKTIVSHPASTSHGRLSEEQRQAAGVTQGLIRVAVGLEHLDDIRADLLRGLQG